MPHVLLALGLQIAWKQKQQALGLPVPVAGNWHVMEQVTNRLSTTLAPLGTAPMPQPQASHGIKLAALVQHPPGETAAKRPKVSEEDVAAMTDVGAEAGAWKTANQEHPTSDS